MRTVAPGRTEEIPESVNLEKKRRMYEAKIVVVDDHEAVLKTLRHVLSRTFRTVVCVSNPALLPALLREGDVDVVLLDMNFGTGKHSGGEGLFWLGRIRECPGPPAVVLMTAFGDIALAVDSLKRGATDFIVKPWDNDKLIETIETAWRQRCLQSPSAGIIPPQKEPRSPAGEAIAFPERQSPTGSERAEEQTLSRLLDSLLKKYAEAYGKPFPRLTPAAFDKLAEMAGRGDLALLQQTVERAVLLVDRSLLDADDFLITEEEGEPASGGEGLSPDGNRLHTQTLEEMEKDFIAEVLREKHGNLTLTAQQLDISRQTLYNKMRKYNL